MAGRDTKITELFHKGMTQAELAKQLDISQSTVQRTLKRLGLTKDPSDFPVGDVLDLYKKTFIGKVINGWIIEDVFDTAPNTDYGIIVHCTKCLKKEAMNFDYMLRTIHNCEDE